ncbi:hypothetical protein [Lysinibacillus agricola]|uniref:hypothetical protein n=1 Tax=Lysinibacillus agricola TaxID=2590012 RepID=UPI003C166D63
MTDKVAIYNRFNNRHFYDPSNISKTHWSELLKVFNLEMSNVPEKDENTLHDFLYSNYEDKEIADTIRFFLNGLSLGNDSFEVDIYKAIASCEDDFTVIKWFANNIRTFYR